MSASTLLDQDTGPVPAVVQPDPLTTTMPDALRAPQAEGVSYKLAAVMRRGTVNSRSHASVIPHESRHVRPPSNCYATIGYSAQ